ncbi:Cyanovirin-N superfamily protein [Pleurotus pulmonarius]
MHDNRYLVAHCADSQGEYKDSTIDLNLCIRNHLGLLLCASGGNYAASCSGCALRSGTSMLCACKGAPEGTHVFVDLGQYFFLRSSLPDTLWRY